jgi:transcriptional regulator with XRE-family HTH domain
MLKSLSNRHNHVLREMLRARREAMRLSQRDVARLLGRGQATVSKVEAGTRRIDVVELRAWLCALDVDFVHFVDEFERRLREHASIDARLLSVQRQKSKPEEQRCGLFPKP